MPEIAFQPSQGVALRSLKIFLVVACESTVGFCPKDIAVKKFTAIWILLLTFPGISCVLSQETEGLPKISEYEKGTKAFAEGDFKAAANYWLADAYLGSPEAQFNIGVLYIEGKGVRENRGEAIFWFRKAAKQGHQEAQYNLGHLLLEQHDNMENITEGIEWWRKSAQGGFAIAQYNYGRALYSGIGTGMDRAGSRQWFERAAKGGIARAASFLEENADSFIDQPVNAASTNAAIDSEQKGEVNEDELPGQQKIDRSEYALVKDNPVLMYARFNTRSPVITQIEKKILLRIVRQDRGWILVEAPGGIPGWVRNKVIVIDKDVVEIIADSAQVFADSTEQSDGNEIGTLPNGTRVLLLERQGSWTRILLPERIPGWIQQGAVDMVVANANEISKVWQAQRIKLKLASLAERKVTDSGLSSNVVNADSGEISDTLVDTGAGFVPQPRNVAIPGVSVEDGEILESGLTATGSVADSIPRRTLKPPPDQ